MKSIPLPAIRRYPLYLRRLKAYRMGGTLWVSATMLAEDLGFSSILVRKDLALTGLEGRPKYGFSIDPLIGAIEESLGWNNRTDAILVGAGNLGSALLGYSGFAQYGLEISAVFDSDPAKIGTKVQGVPVFPMEKLTDFIGRTHIPMAVLTVPAESAQRTAEQLEDAGIRGIWNFAPAKLKLSDKVVVQRVDLASSFAELSSRLKKDQT
ncbi:MAG: redox-sensing transcriptional repressor Rex [Spirochaetales bacterium]|nr:redox-sensing transcriptional repressor Rex [Spirochaetales bacterium]